MTGQPRTFDAIWAEYTDGLNRAQATYAAKVAEIMADHERRTSPELGHMDRRVLDQGQRAYARKHGDTWVVTAGLSTIIATSRDHAWTTALTHNAICGFDQTPENRRTA